MNATRTRGANVRPPRPRAIGAHTPVSVPRPSETQQVPLGHQRAYRVMAFVLVVLMIAFSVAPARNHAHGWQNKDYNLWYQTGRAFLHGEAVYPTDSRPFPFMYPPCAAALLAVVSVLGEQFFVYAILALNSVAWIGSILLSVRLATGYSMRQRPLVYAVPTLWVIPFIHDMYLLGQANLLLLFILLGAFTALRANREGPAGFLVALAAGIKAFPVLAVGYLVYRRRWKALAATVVALAGLLWAMPAVFRGPEKAWSDLKIWTKGMVLKYDEGQIAQRPERCYSFKNQSLVGVANRLLRDVPADGESKDGWQVNFAHLDFRAVNAVVLGVTASLGLFYMVSMRWKRPTDIRAEAAELAMLLLMVLIFSPFAFNYFYVWLIFPLTVLVARLLDAPRGSTDRTVLTAGLAIALMLFSLSAVALRQSQAHGNLLAVNLIFLGLLGWTLHRGRMAPMPA